MATGNYGPDPELIGETVYVCYRKNGQFWNGNALENYNAANWATYDVSASVDANGHVSWTRPADLPAGRYDELLFVQVAGSPAISDAPAYACGDFANIDDDRDPAKVLADLDAYLWGAAALVSGTWYYCPANVETYDVGDVVAAGAVPTATARAKAALPS